MRKPILNGILVGVILLALLAGLGKALLRPKDINYYENRYADQVAPLTAEGVLSGDWQDAFESALTDQLPLAQKLKKLYHLSASSFQKLLTEPLAAAMPERSSKRMMI